MLPILMYHALWPDLEPAALEAHFAADPQLRDPGTRRYALGLGQFSAQLSAINRNGWTTLRDLKELRAAANGEKNILLTFDDGHASNYELALPELKAQQQCALFFIMTDWIGQPGFMNEAQLREMRAAGMMFGSHGCSHRYFSDLSESELRHELADSKRKLEEILKEPVVAIALPGGRDHPQLRPLARDAGYQYIFTSRVGVASSGESADNLPRIPITNVQPPEFLERILAGDFSAIEKMARGARRRGMLKRMLGNQLYDRLRGLVLRKS